MLLRKFQISFEERSVSGTGGRSGGEGNRGLIYTTRVETLSIVTVNIVNDYKQLVNVVNKREIRCN